MIFKPRTRSALFVLKRSANVERYTTLLLKSSCYIPSQISCVHLNMRFSNEGDCPPIFNLSASIRLIQEHKALRVLNANDRWPNPRSERMLAR